MIIKACTNRPRARTNEPRTVSEISGGGEGSGLQWGEVGYNLCKCTFENTETPQPNERGGKGGERMTEKRLSVVAGQSVKGGLTAKQEAFAQGVAEGKTLSEAYRAAYDTSRMKEASVWTEASLLMDHPKVIERVSAIQTAKEERTLHDSARLKRLVLERLHKEATTAESDATRVRALELLGKSIAMFTDRVEQDAVERSAADIERELREKLAGLASRA